MQVERHAYGSEGHREPVRAWSMDTDDDADVNTVLDTEDDRWAAVERRREEEERREREVRSAAARGDFERYRDRRQAPRKPDYVLPAQDTVRVPVPYTLQTKRNPEPWPKS